MMNVSMPSDKGGFIRVLAPDGAVLYGGRQQLLYNENIPPLSSEYDKRLAGFGCGAVALSNILTYLEGVKTGDFDISSEKFRERVISSAEYIPPDSDGIRFMLGCGRLLSRRIRYYAAGITSREKLLDRISISLKADMPVPIGVYCPKKDKGYELRLYGSREEISRTRAHYMLITAIENDCLVISSWGKKFIMDTDTLIADAKKRFSGSLCTGVFIIG